MRCTKGHLLASMTGDLEIVTVTFGMEVLHICPCCVQTALLNRELGLVHSEDPALSAAVVPPNTKV